MSAHCRSANACCRVPGDPCDPRTEAMAGIVVAAVRDMLDCDTREAIKAVVDRVNHALASRGLQVPPMLHDTAALLAAELTP